MDHALVWKFSDSLGWTQFVMMKLKCPITNETFEYEYQRLEQRQLQPICAKFDENNVLKKMLPKNAKKFDTILMKYYGLSGAKACTCKSCRSQQKLFNEHFLAKFGVDTEENEPHKI